MVTKTHITISEPKDLFTQQETKPVSCIKSAKESLQALAKTINNKTGEVFSSITEKFSSAAKSAREKTNHFFTTAKDQVQKFPNQILSCIWNFSI